MILIHWILNLKPPGFHLRAFTQNRYISGHARSGFDFMLAFSVFLKFYFMCIFVLPPGVDNDHELPQCL